MKNDLLGTYVTMVDENGHQTVKQPSDMQALESSKTRDRGPPKHCFWTPNALVLMKSVDYGHDSV